MNVDGVFCVCILSIYVELKSGGLSFVICGCPFANGRSSFANFGLSFANCRLLFAICRCLFANGRSSFANCRLLFANDYMPLTFTFTFPVILKKAMMALFVSCTLSN